MQSELSETDYLVVGAGAAAMAFVDTLLSETDARIILVDRRDRPGGHWNDAYPFVGLHQPAAFYGVASRELSEWKKDTAGLNAGFYGLSTGTEVLSHFEQVMRQRFLPSGRVAFCPMTEYSGESGSHRLTSVTSGEKRYVRPRKLVDATHARTEIPSTHPPKYDVAPGVALISVNGLPNISQPRSRYTVIGSGKTGIDACLWLLQHGVPPGRIRWIMPGDAWLLNRAHSQPGAENFETSMGAVISQFEIITEASSLPDLFHRLEAADLLLRMDPRVEPTRYRCAVVSYEELRALRLIPDIVRLGRVRAVEQTRLILDRGEVPADPDTLYVDCSACAIQMPPTVRVFEKDTINLLMVRTCQPLLSAALIGWVEAHVVDTMEKNALCDPVPSPEAPVDWLRMWAATLRNTSRWRRRPDLDAWLRDCRLNSMNAFLRGVRPDDKEKFALLKRAGETGAAAAARIPDLLSA
jgi:NAD(P)-binding Rossmann-like domain